jgi:(2Fe-2S) ferredoxin
MPQRQHYVFVCLNRRPDDSPKGSCAGSGSEAIYDALRKAVADRKLHRDVVRVGSCSCLDLCHAGPSICVEPDHVCYGKVTLADVPEIVDALAGGRVVERLRLKPEEFDRAKS